MSTTVARSRWLLVLTAVAVAIGALLPSAGTASAHRPGETYLYLDVGDSSLTGRVETAFGDLREIFGLELTGPADEVLAELEANYDAIRAYFAENTAIGAGGEAFDLTFEGVELLGDHPATFEGWGYAVLPFEVGIDQATVPQLIDVTFTPFLADFPGRNNVALVSNDWKRGVIEEEANELLVLSANSPSGTIDLGDSSQWKNFRASVDLGIDHIRTGPDHIFFVIVLLLPSVLVLIVATWRPAASFGESLIRVVIVATMFTVAHSVTFTLAGLDILPLPPAKLVETLIAASIAAAALHNVKPIFGRREWAIAFGFGLFHGMGFAGLVEELDIDRSTQLVSLLGRNVGIEIGQLVIIAVSFPLLFILRRTRVYMPLFYAFSVGLAGISCLWIIERAFEVELGFNGAIDRAVQWPRSLYVIISLTILGVLYRQFEARRGRLLPVGDPHASAGAHDDRDDSDPDQPTPSSLATTLRSTSGVPE